MNIVRIENLSSCDFSCSGSKLRVKRSSHIIDSTGGNMPGSYTAISGTIPSDLKENATVIEIFDDKIGYWIQTSCDPTSYTWSTPVVVDRCCAEGADDVITTFILSGEDGDRTLGSAPQEDVVLPSNPTTGDTLIIKYNNCMTGFYTYDGSDWVLDYHQEDCFPSTTFSSTLNAYTGVPATDQPASPGTYIGDTFVMRYDSANRRSVWGFWTWNGSWSLDFVIDTMGLTNTHVDDSSSPAPIPPAVPATGFPSDPTNGDTVVRKFSDYMVWYTFDGTDWVEDFRCLCVGNLTFDCNALQP